MRANRKVARRKRSCAEFFARDFCVDAPRTFVSALERDVSVLGDRRGVERLRRGSALPRGSTISSSRTYMPDINARAGAVHSQSDRHVERRLISPQLRKRSGVHVVGAGRVPRQPLAQGALSYRSALLLAGPWRAASPWPTWRQGAGGLFLRSDENHREPFARFAPTRSQREGARSRARQQRVSRRPR